ncbi:glutamine--tRNA ligase-like [Galendromus occidentalis]|uniref:Glutamine--tRNA ligase-like n=1 Tax=Galendromus occidentalis TaxID=34638 RepID=A0AAJ6QSN8_9ACAR|nr:glutamine--tRNA ligase-like [Galendromus occidentalis]
MCFNVVQWLGCELYKITYFSDYFDELYRPACVLTERDLAHVCHQSSGDLKGFNPPPSPKRNRPIIESLALSEDLENGEIYEAMLRMKITLEEGTQDTGLSISPICCASKSSNRDDRPITGCATPSTDTAPYSGSTEGSMFIHKNPEDASVVGNGFLRELSLDSPHVGSDVEKTVKDAKTKVRLQRGGFSSVDPDSNQDKYGETLNGTGTLKEDCGKSRNRQAGLKKGLPRYCE